MLGIARSTSYCVTFKLRPQILDTKQSSSYLETYYPHTCQQKRQRGTNRLFIKVMEEMKFSSR